METRTRPTRFAAIAAIALLGLVFAAAGISLRLPAKRAAASLGEGAAMEQTAETRAAVRRAGELSDAFIAIAETVTPAVVRIQAERSLTARDVAVPRGMRQFFDSPVPTDSVHAAIPQVSGGTGVVVSAEGYIVTNNHVVADAERLTVTLHDRRVFPATLVGRDPTTDIAVIRIEAADLPVARLGNSDAARIGEWVIAIGNPGFDPANTLDFTVTSGIISAKGRPLNIIGADVRTEEEYENARYAIEDFIQTDAAINPGNSGGPLADLKGNVIGINTAIASQTGFNQGYGFAVPSNLARRVAEDLIAYGHVRRALMGVTIAAVTPEDAEVYRLPAIAGVLVEDFAEDSPAEAAGLRRHDVIVAIDGLPVERVGQLQRMVAEHAPGEDIQVEVVRYGDARTFPVRLLQAPISQPRSFAGTDGPGPTELGLEVTDLDERTASRLGFGPGGGVVVSRVAPYSAADRKRVLEGERITEINGQPVANAREARTVLRRLAPGTVVSLLLETRDGRTYIANIRVP